MGQVGGVGVHRLFQGRGYCSAVLLGGLWGDGERGVLYGGLPRFLEVALARVVGDEIARKSGAEFYFPGEDAPMTNGARGWISVCALHFDPFIGRWAAAGFTDTLLRWKMKPEVVDGEKKDIQPRVQARGGGSANRDRPRCHRPQGVMQDILRVPM